MKINWRIVSLALCDLGLMLTFLSLDKKHIEFRLIVLILAIVGFAALLREIFKKETE